MLTASMPTTRAGVKAAWRNNYSDARFFITYRKNAIFSDPVKSHNGKPVTRHTQSGKLYAMNSLHILSTRFSQPLCDYLYLQGD